MSGDNHASREPLAVPPIQPGGRAVLRHSWAVGRKNFQRLTCGRPFPLEVELRHDGPVPDRVAVQVDPVGRLDADSRDLVLNGELRHFAGELIAARPGVLRLRVKYLENDVWYWEESAAGWLLADPPWINDLCMYTLLPTVSGTWRAWQEELKRLRDLGCNAVQLLPLTEMDASQSPYAAADLLQLDPRYLDPDDDRDGLAQFADFVAAVKSHGMRLCLDLVFNHVGRHSRIARARRDWLTEDADEADGLRRAGWSDGRNWHRWDDVVLLNYDTPFPQARAELWHYMREYAELWTGFAMETDGLVRLDNLHSSHHGFMLDTLPRLRRQYPNLVLFGELFGSPAHTERLVLDYGLNLLLATPWEQKFAPQLRGYLQGLHACAERLRFYAPTNTHDAGSPTEEFGDPATATARLAVSALLGTGSWGFVQGTEFGLEEHLQFIDPPSAFTAPAEAPYATLCQWLNQMREQHAALRRPGNVHFVDDDHLAMLAAVRTGADGHRPEFLVLVNLDIDYEQTLDLDLYEHGFHVLGSLEDPAGAEPIPLRDGRASLALGPSSFRLFRFV